MKKLILFASILGLGILASPASTMTHFTSRMVTGTYMFVTNAQTASASPLAAQSNVWYYSYSAGTNVQGGATNAVGMQYPNPLCYATLTPDMNADINPNIALQVVVGFTNNLFLSGVQSPIMLNTVWTNPSPIVGYRTQTNSVTVTLTAVSSGDINLPDTQPSAKQFAFTFSMTNGVPVVISTNVPTAFLQGATAVCPSISVAATGGSAGDSATNGAIVNAINLTGWKP